MSEGRSFTFKVIVVGDGAVGKTSLIRRFVHNKFEKDYLMTLGSEITKYTQNIDGNNISLIIWDLAGQEGFKNIRQNFFTGSNAAIIVFSHEENESGEKSLKNVPKWLEEITKHTKKIPIMLFGNKIDLIDVDKLNTDMALPKSDYNLNKLANDLGFLGYYKTSALSGENVHNAFGTLIKELYQKQIAILENLKKEI
ncbi:MAG: Rab family GTPase [Promethearchaeota archaeon]